MQNWLQRAGGFEQFDEPTIEDLIPVAARARRCGVVLDSLAFLALSENEQEALALADAALLLDAREETGAARAMAAFKEALDGERS